MRIGVVTFPGTLDDRDAQRQQVAHQEIFQIFGVAGDHLDQIIKATGDSGTFQNLRVVAHKGVKPRNGWLGVFGQRNLDIGQNRQPQPMPIQQGDMPGDNPQIL